MPGAGTLFDVMEGCGEGSEANPGSGRGDILMKFPPFLRAFDYLILDTDHDSFVSIYSCTPLFFGYAKWELGWVMTRKQNPDRSVVSKTEGFETEVLLIPVKGGGARPNRPLLYPAEKNMAAPLARRKIY